LRRRASFTGTKFSGGGKRGRAKIPSPPTPFLFARPSVQFGARSAPSVPLKKGSDFVKQTHHTFLILKTKQKSRTCSAFIFYKTFFPSPLLWRPCPGFQGVKNMLKFLWF